MVAVLLHLTNDLNIFYPKMEPKDIELMANKYCTREWTLFTFSNFISA